MADERQVRLEIEEPIPEVEVDATRAERALINLVGNAVKYSDPEEADRWVRLSVGGRRAATTGGSRWPTTASASPWRCRR